MLSTTATLAQLGFAKLDEPTRDLEQARLAIETMRALTPVVENLVPPELIRDFNQSVANLQLAYAKAASDSEETGGDEPAG